MLNFLFEGFDVVIHC